MAANPQTSAIATYQTGAVFDSVARLANAIKELGTKHNLVVPGGAIGGQLPLLHAAAVSFVFIDPEHETYPIPGKAERGIGKNALDRIAAAAGVRWDPHLCGRVDDRRSPYIVEYQAVGTVLQLDGTERMIHATKRIDLSGNLDESESGWGTDAQEIARVARMKDPNRDPRNQIKQQRQHILSLAESKAKNRAVRSLGVRTAYAPVELEKGFAIVRLQFTGRHEDPAVERMVAEKIADRALSACGLVYGGGARPALPAVPVPPEAVAPVEQLGEGHHERAADLPVAARLAERRQEPEIDEDGVVLDADIVYRDATSPPAAAPRPQQPAAPAASPGGQPRPTYDPQLICGRKGADGKWPRKPASTFDVDALERKIASAEERKPDWNPDYAAENQRELDAMYAWLAYRRNPAPEPPTGPGGFTDGATDGDEPF